MTCVVLRAEIEDENSSNAWDVLTSSHTKDEFAEHCVPLLDRRDFGPAAQAFPDR